MYLPGVLGRVCKNFEKGLGVRAQGGACLLVEMKIWV